MTSFGGPVGVRQAPVDRPGAGGALREREQLYRLLFERSPSPMWIFDPESLHILAVNQAASRAYGYSPEEFCRLSVLDLRPPEDRPGFRSALERAAHGPVRARHLWRGGEVREVEEIAFEVELSGRALRCAAVTDLAERLRADAARARLAALVESSEDAIIGMTFEGEITSWNAAAERMFGAPAGEVLGRLILPFIPPELHASHLETLARLGRGERVERVNSLRLHRSGASFPVSLTLSPVRDGAGQLVGVASIIRNMSHERGLEEQLRHAQKMEAVGQLASGVAHDFNNLLAAIKASAQMLAREAPAYNADLAEDVQQILLSVDRAVAVTRQLLVFSRKEVAEPQLIDAREVLVVMEKLLRRVIGEHIELRVDAGEPCPVRAHPGHLEQVILNLAVNARDAMPSGGTLRLACARAAPGAAGPPELGGAEAVALTVSDTGVGMDAATLARIFEPFFTTKPVGQGTGLGLSTAYGIVRQAGGAISVLSAVGQGSTFTVWLPLQPGEAAPAARSVLHASHAAGAGTVLLVEDEDALRSALRRLLVNHGYFVLEARSGIEALAIWRGYPARINTVVTDVTMPGMDGRELARQLRDGQPTLGVVMMTGYAQAGELPLSSAADRLAVLHKPFDVDELVGCIEAVTPPAQGSR